MVITPWIEVVMPVYNGSMFLEEQILSIYDQQLRPHKIIIRDDSSIDDTPAILKRLQLKYGSWLHIVPSTSRIGCTASVDILLKISRAPYVALADQDDVGYLISCASLILNFGNLNYDLVPITLFLFILI